MLKKSIILLFCVSLFVACQQNNQLQPSEYADVISQEFTGDLAFKTTSFVEKFWRVAGNTGFNKTVYRIAKQLEKDGYVLEENAVSTTILTYRIETRPLKNPTWESVNAVVKINGEELPLLQHATNRNMIAKNSYSTSKNGVTAEVVYVKDLKKLKTTNVKGKILFVESNPRRVFKTAIIEGGALGIISYNNPKYLQPEINTTSIQFRTIPLDTVQKSWGIALSFAAKERLKNALSKGKVTLNVQIETKIYPSEELTIFADIKGNQLPNERLVFSAHIQEPGANDNATGVGVALEMASVTAKLVKEGKLAPKRTLTFLWGDEIRSTMRYVEGDSIRATNIKWGISLDMVGENTAITGGTFLIEKMPDPSAIWTRGNDKHTEWGGRKLKLKDMMPHYLNDFVIEKFMTQGTHANWKVSTNPFEGGSDHVPFLRAKIPSVLFWHFTDQFYHTDNDRIDKVSKTTLRNVGIASLITGYTLINSDEHTANSVLKSIEKAAVARLNEELKQGQLALQKGDSLKTQLAIISAWEDWYLKTAKTTADMVADKRNFQPEIDKVQTVIRSTANKHRLEIEKK